MEGGGKEREGRKGRREGREDRQGGLSCTTKCSVSNPAHHLKLEVQLYGSIQFHEPVTVHCLHEIEYLLGIRKFNTINVFLKHSQGLSLVG